jgi:hypothetical protein
MRCAGAARAASARLRARGRGAEAERQPHLLLPTFMARVRSGAATSFSMALMACVRALEKAVRLKAPSFVSPMQKGMPVREWGTYAHRCRAGQGAELEPWYEALRLLVVSWEEAGDAAATLLRMYGADKYTNVAGSSSSGAGDGASGLNWPPASVRPAVERFWASVPETFPRFDHLKDILTYQYDGKPGFRGILFVQQVSS